MQTIVRPAHQRSAQASCDFTPSHASFRPASISAPRPPIPHEFASDPPIKTQNRKETEIDRPTNNRKPPHYPESGVPTRLTTQGAFGKIGHVTFPRAR